MATINDDVVLGVQRQSMKRNCVLQKPELEKPTSHCRDLPGLGFAYGVKYVKTGGVAEALCGWLTNPYEHDPPKRFRRKQTKNFVGMNRAAACLGHVNARDQKLVREKHPMFLKDTGDRYLDKKFPPPDIIFGKRYPPSTPISKVMAMRYQKEFVCENRLRDLRQRHISHGKYTVIGKSLPTRASKLAAYKPPPSPKVVLPNAKYDQLTSATESFRSEDARLASLQHQLALENEFNREKKLKSEKASYTEKLMAMPLHLRLHSLIHVPIYRRPYSLYAVDPGTKEKRLNTPDKKDIVLRPSFYLTKKKSGTEEMIGAGDGQVVVPWKPPYA